MTNVDGSSIRRGPFKDQSLRILRDRQIPVGTVLDVGVCHGTPELMKVWPDRKHLLFEPVCEFEEKIRSVYRNLDHELHMVAVGADSGKVGLKVSGVLPGMEISHSSMTDAKSEQPGGQVRTVPRISLDEFLASRRDQEPYLLKIDIDGHELEVLKGASGTLHKCSIVIVEVQSSALIPRIKAVQDAGFKLFDLAEPCYHDKIFWQCDAIFVRADIVSDKFKPLVGKVADGMYEIFR